MGGFAESEILVTYLKKLASEMGKTQLIIPSNPQLAVLKGALRIPETKIKSREKMI